MRDDLATWCAVGLGQPPDHLSVTLLLWTRESKSHPPGTR